MKKNILKSAFFGASVSLLLASCAKKLDLLPTNDVTSESVYSSPAGYKQALAKVYGSFATTGNNGENSGDIQGIDAGTSDFLRLFWKAQELSTDEAVIAWGDPGIQDFHKMNWTSDNPMTKGLYYRALYQITLCNDFIRQSTDAKVSGRGITGADADNIKKYRAEARFLRAYQYWVLMDLFGKPPFADENTAIGGEPPAQISRANLFNWLETEIKAIDGDLVAPKTNEYGRADKAAAWALLARMYLNAGVYTGGTTKYTEAITYSKKVIDAGYSLISDYRWLMLADNQQNTSEAIFTINFDGNKTRNWGGTTFLAHASVGGSMTASNFGLDGGWGGTRTTSAFVGKFPDNSGLTDRRAQFYQAGQNINIADLTSFTDGFAITKYKNISRSGVAGASLTWVDIDFPIFRLSEMYLIYAEAVLRGGTGGDAATALTYVNLIRTRAFGNATGNISAGSLTTDWILDERARELYWEGHRRTDLIRYDKFVESSYLWPWKGGVAGGSSVNTKYKVYPLPSSDVTANPNLSQNTGY
jgi:starch-binding outer membrane protein, SusD/RagB family